ncbi:hypothetical protein HY745_15290, partial [Candidatus Desantisbacteria bacterium]|nr:hypothetical protein [Candidatus Desantisbacteria bacterium]
MRVLLSNPPWFIEGGNRWGIRAGSRWPFTLPCGSGYYPFPFLMSHAASYLRENGIEAYMVDSILTRESYNSFIKRIKEIKFDWVIIETSTPSIEHDLKLCEDISKYSKVALSGPHATTFAEELIKKPYIKAILKGEYEKNSLELLRTGEEKVYDYNLTEDINTLPFPYRDYSIYNYADHFPVTPKGPQLQIWGSRGCPFKCVFCLWPPIMYKNKYRARKPSNILEEIKVTLKNFPKFRSIYFDDDTFNIGKDRMMEIC